MGQVWKLFTCWVLITLFEKKKTLWEESNPCHVDYKKLIQQSSPNLTAIKQGQIFKYNKTNINHITICINWF